SEKMRGQIRGLDMATKNAQDGISLIQTAEGALTETHAILQRMNELAVQASSDTNIDKNDREAMQEELNALQEEINAITDRTEFNTQNLLKGDFKDMTFHIGANQGQNIKVSIDAMDALNIGIAETVEVEEGTMDADTATSYGFVDEEGAGLDDIVTMQKGDKIVGVQVDDKFYAVSDVKINADGDAVEVKNSNVKEL